MSRSSSRSRRRVVGMRRWDGQSRITTDWFGHHNDLELNFVDGDLLILLHEPTSLRRGASFRLHAEFISATGFYSLLDRAVTMDNPTHWALPAKPNQQPSATVKELYLPAPPDADKDTIARFHLATRNFFAWIYDRPLTGKTLGASLVDVMTRAHQYRPDDPEANRRDMMAYLQRRGYMDFRECVDHALAVLHLAETFQMETLWVNAFAHAVGMNHALHASIEFDAMSRVTKALITRTRLEMDIRLDRVANSLTTFFDSDLSGQYLGLTQTAKDHMERFRSFLHAYYIESHGFWPPSGFATSFALRRSLYRSMYVEFRALYEYLVDQQPIPALSHDKRMAGGICTLQNVRAFDDRYRLETLPRPLPLLPISRDSSASVGFTIRKRRLEKEARNLALLKALSDASNRDPELLKSRLVRRYNQFEQQTVVDDFDPVNLTEGRKVRWILIYAIFQILASVIAAPKEVRDTEGLSYPLCCHKPKTLPWIIDMRDQKSPSSTLGAMNKTADAGKGTNGGNQEVRPDVDYLRSPHSPSSASQKTTSTGDSGSTRSTTSSRPTASASKSSKTPSLLRFLQRRKPSSTSARADSPTLPPKAKTVQFNEILVYGYGNGLNETIDDTPKTTGDIGDAGHVSSRKTSPTPSINNSSFVKKSFVIPADNQTLSESRPLSLRSSSSTTLQLPHDPSPSLESPTNLPLVSTINRNSSQSSAASSDTSHLTSDTSNSSHTSASEPAEQQNAKEDAETLTTSSNTSTPVATPAPEDPEPLSIRYHTVTPAPIHSPASNRAMVTKSILKSTERKPGNPAMLPQKATAPPAIRPKLVKNHTAHAAIPSRQSFGIAGPEKYLNLSSDLGPGRSAMPSAFIRSASYTGSSNGSGSGRSSRNLSRAGSFTSVNVIQEEVGA